MPHSVRASLLMALLLPLCHLLPAADNNVADDTAGLLFYLPFDGDNLPAWAQGSPLPLYHERAPEYLPGRAGLAARYDRIPKPNAQTGWMNYFIGTTFSGRDNIPQEQGTIELWFSADPALLTHPDDKRFYFFSVNRAAGMQLYLSTEKGKLELVYAEGEFAFSWPQGERRHTLHEKRASLPETDFCGRWHHLALTYDLSGRHVFLDGREVISMDPLPQSPVTSIDLNIAWGGRLGPWTFFGLLDELKVWNRVLYREAFTPEAQPLPRTAPPPPNLCPGPRRHPKLQITGASATATTIILDLSLGQENCQLAFTLADGMPFLLDCDPGKQLGRELRDRQPEPVLLDFASVDTTNPASVRATLAKYPLALELTATPVDGRLSFRLALANRDPQWMLLLEPQFSLSRPSGQTWHTFFDGSGQHDAATLPEKPFAMTGTGMIFPVNAAWNERLGLALAFAPDQFFSWFRQGKNATGELASAWRTVIDPQTDGAWRVELFSFDPRFGSDDAIARYHADNPAYFRLDPRTDWRIHTGSAYASEAFYLKKYWHADKQEYFSGQEINRRAGNYWQWFYRSGESTGDWAITPFFNDNSPPFNGLFGALPPVETHRASKIQAFEQIHTLGIANNFYFLPWFERRYVKYFTDSLFSPLDIDNAQPYYDGWWRGGMRDYAVMPWGTRAGLFFRDSLAQIMQQYPQVDGFAFDVLEGNHAFRGATTLNTDRAYDRDGVFADFMLGYARIAEWIKNQRRHDGTVYSLSGNPHLWRTTFPALFRMDTIIFEGRYFEFINATPQLRQTARFLGSKRPSLYQSGSTDYVGNYYPHSADFTPEQAAAAIALYHGQTFLRCFLNNLRPTPHLIGGFTELQDGMADFKRLMRHEYQFVSATHTRAPVQAARYGDPAGGIIALVNPALAPQQATLTLDHGYLQAVPLLGAAGIPALECRGDNNSQQAAVTLAPLAWQLIDTFAALDLADGATFAARSTYSCLPDRRMARVTFTAAPGTPVRLRLALLPFETLAVLTLNQKPLPPDLPFSLNNGDVLTLEIADRRWLSPAAEITAFPFLHPELTIICADPALLDSAKRFQEYFRFWTANTPGQDLRLIPLGASAPANAAAPLIAVTAIPPESGLPPQGVRRRNGRLEVWAPADQLTRQIDTILDALDTVYPHPGRTGYQNTDASFNQSKVATQKTLQRDVAGKRWRLADLLPLMPNLPPRTATP